MIRRFERYHDFIDSACGARGNGLARCAAPFIRTLLPLRAYRYIAGRIDHEIVDTGIPAQRSQREQVSEPGAVAGLVGIEGGVVSATVRSRRMKRKIALP